MDRCAPSVRCDPFAFHRAIRAIAAAFAWIVANGAFAAESTSVHRYELMGSGTLQLDAPVLHNGSLHLQAELTPAASVNTRPVAQSGSSFELAAVLSAQSLVCYNDTIFRDDFDGDGF